MAGIEWNFHGLYRSSPDQKRNDKEDQEQEKQDFGKSGGHACDPHETQKAGDNRY
jgi:hypothetical protein